jgi:cbb3-type cytochrome oxidase maturation protein
VRLLAIWLVYTFFGVGFFSLIFIWAVRTGQFGDQDRARRMPLECPDPACESPHSGDRRAALRVMLAPYALLLLGAVVIVGTSIYVFSR